MSWEIYCVLIIGGLASFLSLSWNWSLSNKYIQIYKDVTHVQKTTIEILNIILEMKKNKENIGKVEKKKTK